MRALVEMLAAYGIPEDEMVKLVENPETKEPISLTTLRAHFRRELDRGFTAANVRVATGLFKNATMPNATSQYGDKVSQFFWLKCRGRWQERHRDEEPPPPPVDESTRLEIARRVAFLLISTARGLPTPTEPTTPKKQPA